MKSKFKLILCICILVSINVIAEGCTKKAATTNSTNGLKQSTPTEIQPAVVTEQKYLSPYTGEEVKKEEVANIAVLAIVENSIDARPQSGLNSADIVYETMAEGGIPRLIALFQKNNALKIGPIRSARPYFLTILKEYNLPLAHCGGSAEATEIIKAEKLMSMDEMVNSSAYVRDNERKAPHNLYTSSEKLRELIKAKTFVKEPTVKLKFDKTYWDSVTLSPATDVLLKMNGSYNTSYAYKDGLYLKTMDGKPSANKEDQIPLAIKNVVVQITTMKLQPDKLHINIDLIGQGDGYVISNGKFVKMHWNKKDANSQTLLTDEKGIDLPLNPGKTWWNIVDTDTTVTIK
ncbi:MAG: DUF3048 domain-containing protein [Clostridiaceae bacterium]|nr:DUF3048 domain-containing protein [Clostridiaceae bacterium]